MYIRDRDRDNGWIITCLQVRQFEDYFAAVFTALSEVKRDNTL